jgi:hypothetical protein
MCPTPLDRQYMLGRMTSLATVVSMGKAIRGGSVRPRRHGYLFVIQQLTEHWPGCQDPGVAISQIVLMGYMETCG